MNVLPLALFLTAALAVQQPTAGTATHESDTADTADVAALPAMVVTATRTQRAVESAPVSVSVIERGQIDVAPAKNVDGLLERESGVTIKRVVGIGEGIPSDIVIRGVPGAFSAARTLILVDGIPTNVSGTPFLITNIVPMNGVDKVELVRGPFSSLYGANAFNGVVNIMTHTPTRPFEMGAYHEFWPLLYSDVGGQAGGSFEKADVWVAGSYRRIDNYLVNDEALIQENFDSVSTTDAENYDYSDIRVLGKAHWWANDRLRLTLQARYFRSDLGFGFTKDTFAIPVRIQGETFLVGPSASIQFTPRVSMDIQSYARRLTATYHNDLKVDSLYGDTSGYVESLWEPSTDDASLTATTTIKLGRHQRIAAGADYLYSSARMPAMVSAQDGAPIPGVASRTSTIHSIGIFVQDEIELCDRRLNIVPGARLDYHSAVGLVFSPKLATSWAMLPDLSLRASAGRAFRAPTHVELYAPDIPLVTDVLVSGTDSLAPEYIIALDGGLDYRLKRYARLRIGGFYNWMDSLIVPMPYLDASLQPHLSHRNISQARSGGLELEAQTTWPDWVTFRANYTYTQSVDLLLDEPLDYVPSHVVTLMLSGRQAIGDVTVSGSVTENYVGERSYLMWQGSDVASTWRQPSGSNTLFPPRRTLPAYWRTDVGLRVDYRERAYLSLSVQNLFDVEYEESGGTWAPGRLMALQIGGNY